MKKKFIIIIGIALAIIATIIIGLTVFYINVTKPVSNQSEEVEIKIEDGTLASEIGKILEDAKLIRSGLAYNIYVKIHGINSMKAGIYTLNKNMNLSDIIQTLEKGADSSKSTVNITFLEGKNFRWIAKRIAEETNNTEEDVYSLVENEEYLNSVINKYWFITEDIKNEEIYYALEGYLFPDTYNFKNKDVKVQEIFQTMLDEMEKKLEKYKQEIQDAGVSVHKLLTVASIAELESSNAEDRAKVASVIYNRLKSNMPLGSDVTTYYAVKVDMGERELYKSELNKANAYNTRGPNMNGKLPIGPICMVGEKSVEAALHPDNTKYYYFVADKNGKVYFSESSSAQEQVIKRLKQQDLWYEYE